MDAYRKAWLQFVFPLYIWLLVGLMILVSLLSRRFSKLLVTTQLLSWQHSFYKDPPHIDHCSLYHLSNIYNRMVWLYDANIDYLSGKHIPLFIVAVLIFLFLFLPYTLLLLFGQWLQAMSNLRLFSWINRLKKWIHTKHLTKRNIGIGLDCCYVLLCSPSSVCF